ncbi:hypothetical protein D3C75_1054200 [compost metagenome]
MHTENPQKCQQNPGYVVVRFPGVEAQVRLPIHRRNQEQVDQPANPQQTQGEEPNGSGYRLAVIETVGTGEAENPQQIANDFAVGVLRSDVLLITVHFQPLVFIEKFSKEICDFSVTSRRVVLHTHAPRKPLS